MIRIQILSDLHLESPKGYDVFEVFPSAPYLALVGDIGEVKDAEYFAFIEKQLSNFEVVFLLFGNHEPYSSDWNTAKHKMKEFEMSMAVKVSNGTRGKFIFLDQTRYDLSPDVTILGCTLHSHILPEQEEHVSFGLNDFYYIANWTVEDHNEAHSSDLVWLNQQVEAISKTEPDLKVVILSHHSPTVSPQASDPQHGQSNISSAFVSDLSSEACWTNKAVKIWAFGHTHFNVDFVVDGKRAVTNQRGYFFRQASGFDENKCIEI